MFDSVTTGASNDIEQATRIARAMITRYGMSKKFGMMGIETAANQYLNDRTVMNCSDETAAEVDREVMKVLEESYEKAKQLLNEHREALDKIAAYLIEKETITGKEFMEILEKVEQPKEEPVQEEAPEQAEESAADTVEDAASAKEEVIPWNSEE